MPEELGIMNKLTIILCTALSYSSVFAGDDIVFIEGFESAPPETSSKNVFISGHSLMDNPFAEYLASISTDKGVDYQWNQQIVIGSPIRVRTSGNQYPPNNWQGYSMGKNRNGTNMDTIAELETPATIGVDNKYDVLLITENHHIMGTIVWEYTNSLLRHYHDRLLAGNANGKTMLYHSWLDIDPNNPQNWIDFETLMLTAWECVAEKVNLTLGSDGLGQNVSVVPAGWALTNLLVRILNDEVSGFTGTDLEKIDLLFNDNVHLNKEGVFYMAAVSYVSIYGVSPVGASIPVEIDNATGQDLLQIAWENVNAYRQNYQAKTMAQCRQIIETQICDSYYTYTGRPDVIASCQTWINNTAVGQYNPFNWPDNNLIVWPSPN